MCFIYFVLRYISAREMPLLERIDLAKSDLNLGKLAQAETQYKAIYADCKDKALCVYEYTSFLYKKGNYKAVKNIYETTKVKLTARMSDLHEKCLKNIKMESRLNENIEYLYKESPYCREYVTRIVTKLMRDFRLSEVRDILNAAQIVWATDKEIKLSFVHLLFLEGKYDLAFEQIPAEKKNLKIFNVFNEFLAKSKEIEKMSIDKGDSDYSNYLAQKQSEHKFRALKKIIDDMKDSSYSDTFSPTILSHLRYTLIEAFLLLGNTLIVKGISKYAREAMKFKPTDENKYLYINNLIVEGEMNEAEIELEQLTFKNSFYKDRLDGIINREKHKAEEKEREQEAKRERQRKEEAMRKEEQKRQWQRQQQQQQQRYGKQGGDDPKGYYKILNLDKTATEDQIRKKYKKLSRAKDPDNYKGKDENKRKELNEELMKINEAKTVLLDKEKRQLYDQGLLDQQQQGGYRQASGADVNDIFKAFFGGGGGGSSTFFTSGGQGGFFSGSSGGGGRHEQRTYFYL